MQTKQSVTKFFDDNLNRISSHADPLGHNLNAGLLALVNYLDSRLTSVSAELHQLRSEVNDLQRKLSAR